MLYVVMGSLLGRASEVLDRADLTGDDFARRQERRVVSLLRRVAGMWPNLWVTLERQNTVLAAAARDAGRALAEHGVPLDRRVDVSRDALAAHRDLHALLDEQIVALHGEGSADWATEQRRRVRRALADAAALEHAMVQATFGPARAEPR
jgi:hypothetical protein